MFIRFLGAFLKGRALGVPNAKPTQFQIFEIRIRSLIPKSSHKPLLS